MFRMLFVRFSAWSGLHHALINLTDLYEALTEWNVDETRRRGLIESRPVHHEFQSYRGLKQRFRGKETATIIANYEGHCYRCFNEFAHLHAQHTARYHVPDDSQ